MGRGAYTAYGNGLLIGGDMASGAGMVHDGPMRRGEPAGTFTSGSEHHIDAAVRAARGAAGRWAAVSVQERAATLLRLADLIEDRQSSLSAVVVAEIGKPVRDAEAEVGRAVASVRWVAGAVVRAEGEVLPSAVDRRLLFTMRAPLGVVGLITPWNFPVAIALWKAAPALARGNAIVWKPSELAPLSPTILAEALAEAGFPAGVVNVVPSASRGVGRHLAEHPGIDAISFTGSVATGQEVRMAAARRGAKVQAELGGKNAAVVCDDANLDVAVELVTRGAMTLAGQRCTATSRVIVQRRIADRFAAKLTERVQALTLGDPADRATDVGPVASASQFEKVCGHLDDLRDEATEVLLGGAPARDDRGPFIVPTVYRDPGGQSGLATVEVFGPVVGIELYEDLDDAIRMVNVTRYGLSASIFTGRLSSALRFSGSVRTGVVHVNGETAGTEPHAPYGGLKDSGSHAPEQGAAGLDFFADTKTVYLDPT